MATVTHNNSIDHHREDPSRKRTRATAEQLAVLEDTFSVNVSPNSKLRKQLADQLKMTDRSIQIWFQNRRAKVKHMQKRAQLQMHQASMRAQLYHYQQQHYYLQQHYAPHQRAHSLDSYNLYRSTPATAASTAFITSPYPVADPHAMDIYPTSSFDSSNSCMVDQQRQSVPPPSLLPYAEMVDLNPDPWNFSVSPTHSTAIDPTNLLMNSFNLGLSISSLAIGRWHRLKMQPKDLECVYQPERQVLCWNIVDGQHCFRMEMPVTSIRQMTYTCPSSPSQQQTLSTCSLYESTHEPLLTSSPLSPSPSLMSSSTNSSTSTTSMMMMGELHLDLYHPPLFYMKHQQDWVSCMDFTEHQQASQVLHHTLKGMGLALWQELSTLISNYPETQQWIRLNSSICHSGPLAGLAEEPLCISTKDQTPTDTSSPSSPLPPQSSSSLSSSSAVVPALSLLPVTKLEESFTTPACAADDFLIDPSLLDPSLWSSTAMTTTMNSTASTGTGFIIS